jgi:hypothetical protein
MKKIHVFILLFFSFYISAFADTDNSIDAKLNALSTEISSLQQDQAQTNLKLKQAQAQIAKLEAENRKLANTPSVRPTKSTPNSISNEKHNTTFPTLQTNSSLSESLFNNVSGSRISSPTIILQDRANNLITNNSIYIGGLANGSGIYTYTQLKQPGEQIAPTQLTYYQNTDQLEINKISIHALGTINSWSTYYLSFLNKNMTDGTNSYTGLSNAYFIFGNFNASPWYAVLGKNNINFGSFQSVNVYMMPLDAQAFQANSVQAELGANSNDLNASFSLFDTDSELNQTGQIPITNPFMYDNPNTTTSPAILYTGKNQALSDWAANVTYKLPINTLDWTLGGGYLYGGLPRIQYYSNYNQTAHYARNGAWDLNTSLAINQNWKFLAEYVTNQQASAPGLNRFQTWDLGGSYTFLVDNHKSSVNLDYSELYNTPYVTYMNGSLISNQLVSKQYVIGYKVEVVPQTLWTGIEFARRIGIDYAASNTGAMNTIVLNLTAIF